MRRFRLKACGVTCSPPNNGVEPKFARSSGIRPPRGSCEGPEYQGDRPPESLRNSL